MQTITLNMHTVKNGICLCNKKHVSKTHHAYKPEELNTLSWVSCPLCELAKTCAQIDTTGNTSPAPALADHDATEPDNEPPPGRTRARWIQPPLFD
ncbi:hypothetical protein PG2093B_0094 [Bifidobacterium pseudolongum subsp. globosum]|uniref:Uncharacterized protein n=1 Tax=Bifidobacterium pseudolongum subsp. globosum TaxID=1690 RepID=A0A4Q5A2R1_9BIFI|nr:hypothetical protein [Bifidobacterium pseudolongum]RYQ12518.1 hypothetical protein PG2093B_0094 [Bifidobacterium pseudolongum subsp. globosum]